MPPEQPRGRETLTGVMLALSRHRCMTTCRRYAVIGVIAKCCCMHIDGGRGHESVLVHQTDAVIVGSAPYPGVGRHRQVEVTRNLEGGLLGECRVAGHVEGNLHAQHIAAPVDAAPYEVGELGGLCPL